MFDFIYSAWFLDTAANPDDEDHEWVAVIGIKASTKGVAKDWGDALASGRADRHPTDKFVRSSVERVDEVKGVTDWATVPRIRAGNSVTDDEIGW